MGEKQTNIETRQQRFNVWIKGSLKNKIMETKNNIKIIIQEHFILVKLLHFKGKMQLLAIKKGKKEQVTYNEK